MGCGVWAQRRQAVVMGLDNKELEIVRGRWECGRGARRCGWHKGVVVLRVVVAVVAVVVVACGRCGEVSGYGVGKKKERAKAHSLVANIECTTTRLAAAASLSRFRWRTRVGVLSASCRSAAGCVSWPWGRAVGGVKKRDPSKTQRSRAGTDRDTM
jgi:hypothetical protein